MKKLNFLLIFLCFCFLIACSSEESFDRDESKLGVYSSKFEGKLKKQMTSDLKYYNYCKDELEMIKSTSRLSIACKKGDLVIEALKDNDTNTLYQLIYIANEDNEDVLFAELNNFLKTNGYNKITKKDYDKISENNYTTIGSLMYNRIVSNSKVEVTLKVNTN